MVDVPQLELAVCGGRDDVGRVEELDVGNGFPVSLENVRSGTIPIFSVTFLYKIVDMPGVHINYPHQGKTIPIIFHSSQQLLRLRPLKGLIK